MLEGGGGGRERGRGGANYQKKNFLQKIFPEAARECWKGGAVGRGEGRGVPAAKKFPPNFFTQKSSQKLPGGAGVGEGGPPKNIFCTKLFFFKKSSQKLPEGARKNENMHPPTHPPTHERTDGRTNERTFSFVGTMWERVGTMFPYGFDTFPHRSDTFPHCSDTFPHGSDVPT